MVQYAPRVDDAERSERLDIEFERIEVHRLPRNRSDMAREHALGGRDAVAIEVDRQHSAHAEARCRSRMQGGTAADVERGARAQLRRGNGRGQTLRCLSQLALANEFRIRGPIPAEGETCVFGTTCHSSTNCRGKSFGEASAADLTFPTPSAASPF